MILAGIFSGIGEALWTAVMFIYDKVSEFGNLMIAGVLASLPDEWQSNVSSFVGEGTENMPGLVETWVPLRFGLGLLMAYLSIKIMFILMKFVLKLIPTIG